MTSLFAWRWIATSLSLTLWGLLFVGMEDGGHRTEAQEAAVSSAEIATDVCDLQIAAEPVTELNHQRSQGAADARRGGHTASPPWQPVDKNPDLARKCLQRFGKQVAGAVGDNDDNQKNSGALKSVFREVVAAASRSTVEVLCDGKLCALGTAVDVHGLILTKYSELKGKVSCRIAEETLEADIAAFDEDHDLALLSVDARLQPIRWSQSAPRVGSLLAAASPDSDPVAIGVASVLPRKIPPRPGMLGIVMEEGDRGPIITEVMDDSGAKAAGVLKGDVVLAVNGKRTPTRQALIQIVRRKRAGDKLKLTLERDDKELKLTATLGNWPDGPPGKDKGMPFNRRSVQNWMGGALSGRRAGFPSVLQHDTVLKPQDCGGPLVNLDGQAVGINIARAGRVMSYAIPTSVVTQLLPKLKAEAKAKAVADEKKEARLMQLRDQLAKIESRIEELSITVSVTGDEREQEGDTRLELAEQELTRLKSTADALRLEMSRLGDE